MANSGVYEITNTINGKRYVGSSVDLNIRKQTHWSRLREGKHFNRYLQNAWNKYGERAFQFNVLLYCDQELLLEFEQPAIDQRSEYNLCPKAGNRLGVKNTPEACANISRGKTNPSLETRAKYSATTRKRFQDPEQRREQSEMMKRNWQDPDYRANQIEKATGRPSPLRGIPLSPEHGAKIAEANRRRKVTKETRAKMSVAHTGFKHTEESKAKMSKVQRGKAGSRLGHTTPKETRAKQSAAAKGVPWTPAQRAANESYWTRRREQN